MSFKYVDTQTAIAMDGLRMVVVGGVPSPWSEAVKGILKVKKIDWYAVRFDYEDTNQYRWTKATNAPVAIYNDESPKTNWNDILFLTERINSDISLIPKDPLERALMFGLSHELCGENGLGWARRLQLVHAGLNNAGGFAAPIAQYLGKKYGYSEALGEASTARIVELLIMLSNRLKSQMEQGHIFYIGDQLSALDIYSAVFVNLFDTLSEHQRSMSPQIRSAWMMRDTEVEKALDQVLTDHRDTIFNEWLGSPSAL
jgi:glutathione S-transferase